MVVEASDINWHDQNGGNYNSTHARATTRRR